MKTHCMGIPRISIERIAAAIAAFPAIASLRNATISILRTMALLAILETGSLHAQVDVLTANYGNDRTNANLREQILNTSDVSSGQFGKLFSLTVDGQIYAQPLYASGIALPGGGVLNLVYTVTMHNSVYAFDADSGSLIWQVNLGPSVPSSNYGSHYGVSDTDPEVGILSTPVIDLQSQVLYVVANKYQDGAYFYRLHALDLVTGAERMNGPVTIEASVRGTGADSVDGTVFFNPLQHLQRPGLLLSNNVVYIAFASHGDQDPYHGWIVGYNAHDLSQQSGAFNVTPNGAEGGIWQSGRGLAADDQGDIYAISGNGDSDGTVNFGESFLRLTSNSGLAVADWFTPSDWNQLDAGDLDLGSAGPVLVPGTNLMVGASKLGMVYVVDRTRMGGLWDGKTQTVQSFRALRNWIFNFAMWNSSKGNILYMQADGDGVKAFCMSDRAFGTTPCASNSSVAGSAKGGIVVSADGSTPGTAILWTTTTAAGSAMLASGTLHAFDASDISKELWNSDFNGATDALGSFAKFANPTIAAGKVYVPTFSGQLVVYGLK